MTGFPKSARILSRADFRQTMDHGAKIVCPGVVLFATPRGDVARVEGAETAAKPRRKKRGDGAATRVRFGVVVSKKVGNSVVRNRVKRRLREAWRALRPDIENAETFKGLDVVALARPQAADAASADIANGLTRCLDRLAQRLSATKGR